MAFGGTVKLTGESEYRKALKGIADNLKVLNSEMKVVTSQYDKNDSSSKKLKDTSEVLNKKIKEQEEKVRILKSALASAESETGKNSTTTKKWQTELNNAQSELNKLNRELDGQSDNLEEASEKASIFGETLKAKLVGEAIISGVKMLGSALKEVSGAFVNIGKQAIASYGEYEQLVGGVETLFGESAKQVLEYSKNAYVTAGMSANKYMETITSFSASLLQSLDGDTAKATEISNMAITDMADNSNKLGTSIDMIEHAYQGFAKGNYTMLDNLKLGYGGTAREMARLVNESGVLGDALIDLDDKANLGTALGEVGFAKMVEAIHVVQEEMGIMGTTSAEASGTIQGSVGSMQASWQNLITGIADDNADFSQLVDNFVVSLIGDGESGGMIGNMLPRIETALDGIANLVVQLADKLVPKALEIGINLTESLISGIAENLPSMLASVKDVAILLVNTLKEKLPKILEFGESLIDNITSGIQSNLPSFISKALDVVDGFGDFLTENVPKLITKGIEMIRSLVKGVMDSLPELISRVPEIISKFANVINDNAPTIIKAGFNILVDIGKGLINVIPTLIKNIPKILTAILDVWEAFNWVNLGEKVVNFICNGIDNMVYFAMSSIGNIKNGIVNGIKNLPQNLWDIGKNAISNMGSAISSMKTSIANTVTTLATNLLNAIKNTLSWSNLKSIGTNLVQGLWNGISDMAGWVLNKIKGFGSSVLNGIKSFFGIHSPSTVFRDEVGKNLALGVGEGFGNTMDAVTESMQGAIPREFDTNVSMNVNSQRTMEGNRVGDLAVSETLSQLVGILTDRDKIKEVIVDALNDGSFKVVLDGREVGRVVRKYA